MQHPVAATTAPSPEKRGESARTANRPNSAAAMAPVFSSARFAVDEVRALFKQHLNSLHYRRLLAVQQHSVRLGTAPRVTGLAAVMEAVLTGISGMLLVYFLLCSVWYVCLLYGAFGAAVATMVSVLAWACLGLFGF